MALRTDYQDFVANAAGKKYRIIDAGDGMVTIQDVTTYDQIGDSFSAGVINATNEQVNKNSNQIRSNFIAYNHIDNGDFTQFIAQAGIGGSHGTQAYAGDRWIIDSGTVTGEANDNGNGYKNIKLNGSIRQKVANPPTVGTAFVEMVSGTATVSYSNGEVTVTSSGGVIKYVDLFEGEYTADNRPKHMPKGYAAELAECRRYYRQSFDGTSAAVMGGCITGFALSNYALLSVLFDTPMRITPTVTVYNLVNGGADSVTHWSSDGTIPNVGMQYLSRYGFIPGAGTGPFTKLDSYGFHYSASADL